VESRLAKTVRVVLTGLFTGLVLFGLISLLQALFGG